MSHVKLHSLYPTEKLVHETNTVHVCLGLLLLHVYCLALTGPRNPSPTTPNPLSPYQKPNIESELGGEPGGEGRH